MQRFAGIESAIPECAREDQIASDWISMTLSRGTCRNAFRERDNKAAELSEKNGKTASTRRRLTPNNSYRHADGELPGSSQTHAAAESFDKNAARD